MDAARLMERGMMTPDTPDSWEAVKEEAKAKREKAMKEAKERKGGKNMKGDRPEKPTKMDRPEKGGGKK